MTQSNRPLDRSTPLAVAYAAFRRTGPSEFEVNAAVRRLQARIRGRRQQPARRQRSRRGSFLACAAIFVGAIAYAAGALGGRSTSSSAPTSRSVPTNSRLQLESTRVQARQNWIQPRMPNPDSTTSSMPGSELARNRRDEAVPPRSTSTRAQSSATPAPAPRGAADWGVVAEAMASNDYARAERALAELARSDTRETRLNALLGQAQLASGRGDCVEARRLATSVLKRAPSDQTRRRAEQVLARCMPESGARPR